MNSNKYVSLENLLKLNNLIPFKSNITLNLSEGPHRIMVAIQTKESRFSSVPIAYQTIEFIIDTTNAPWNKTFCLILVLKSFKQGQNIDNLVIV